MGEPTGAKPIPQALDGEEINPRWPFVDPHVVEKAAGVSQFGEGTGC